MCIDTLSLLLPRSYVTLEIGNVWEVGVTCNQYCEHCVKVIIKISDYTHTTFSFPTC